MRGKSIKTSRTRIEKQLKGLWCYVETVYAEKEQKPNEPDSFEAIDPKEVLRTIDQEIGLVAMAHNLKKVTLVI